jgi:hypothetical protein
MSRRLAALVTAFAVLVATGCKTETPVSPVLPKPALGISILPSSGGGPNSLTLEGRFCSCANGPVTVSINGKPAGTLGCGETKTFPNDALPVRLQLESPEILPFDGVFGAGDPTRPDIVLGLRVAVVCAS